MKMQKVGYQELVLGTRCTASRSGNPDSALEKTQNAIKWGPGFCRRLGRTFQRALDRSIEFHSLQTIDSYKWLL